MSPHGVSQLYQKIPVVLNNTTLIGQARKSISRYFKSKYKVSITKSFVFKLKSIKGISRKKINFLLRTYIQYLPIPRFMKRFIQSRIVVTFTRASSIKDILSNNIKFGKNWRRNENISCNCKHLHRKFKIPLNKNNHIQVNSKQLEKGPLKNLLNRNCRDKCIPNASHFDQDFQIEFKKLVKQITSTIKIVGKSI